MESKKIILTTFLALLLSFSFVSAADFDVTVPEGVTIIKSGQRNVIELQLVNNRGVSDSFYVSVWPTQWVSLDRYWIGLNASESTKVLMAVEPPISAQAGNYIFTVTVTSVSTTDSISKEMVLNLKRETGIFISDLKLNQQLLQPGDELTIQPVISNLDFSKSESVIVTTKILKDRSLIQSFEDETTVEPLSKKTITNVFDITNAYTFGDYSITVELKDSLNRLIDQKDSAFKIKKVEDTSKERTSYFAFFYSTVAIKITNTGNAPISEFLVSESIPTIMKYFFVPEIEPVSEEAKDNRIVYTWKITDLNPTEAKTIIYQFRFYSIFIVSVVIILGAAASSYVYFRPTLTKRSPRLITKQEEFSVSIHVRNRSLREIKDIVVRDFVPPLAKVIQKFDTLPPKIKVTREGTSLEWKVDKLRPNEERVFTYRIMPVMEVPDGLKLPRAHFTYEGKRHPVDHIAEKIIATTERVR